MEKIHLPYWERMVAKYFKKWFEKNAKEIEKRKKDKEDKKEKEARKDD